VVIRVDSESEAVMVNPVSVILNRKLSRMGMVLLLLITLLIAVRWLSSPVLDTTNFMDAIFM